MSASCLKNAIISNTSAGGAAILCNKNLVFRGAVRFFAYRFFYYYFYGSADLSPAQGAYGKAAMA